MENALENRFKHATESNKEANSNETSLSQSQIQQMQNQLELFANQLKVVLRELTSRMNIENELKEKLKENEELREITLQLNSKINEYENEIKLLKNDKDELNIRNAELCEKYQLLKQVNAKQVSVAAQSPIDHNSSEHQYKNRFNSESTVLIESQIPSAQHTTTTTASTASSANSRYEQLLAMSEKTKPVSLEAEKNMIRRLNNKNRVFLDSRSDTNIAAPILPDIDIINKYDLDVSTVGWQLPFQFKMRDQDLLEMYENLLVDYYRINLTLKYHADFESYFKESKPKHPCLLDNIWYDLCDKFPDKFYSHAFIHQIEKYRYFSDDVHLLKKPQFKIMRAVFTRNKVDKNWLDLLEFVDKNFDSIDQHRKKLEKYNLI